MEIDRRTYLCAKGNNHQIQYFNREFLVDELNLWSDKFWTVFNKKTKNIEIYEVATMKLHHVLPFHYFDVMSFKCNQKQPSFIAGDKYGRQYCVIDRV